MYRSTDIRRPQLISRGYFKSVWWHRGVPFELTSREVVAIICHAVVLFIICAHVPSHWPTYWWHTYSVSDTGKYHFYTGTISTRGRYDLLSFLAPKTQNSFDFARNPLIRQWAPWCGERCWSWPACRLCVRIVFSLCILQCGFCFLSWITAWSSWVHEQRQADLPAALLNSKTNIEASGIWKYTCSVEMPTWLVSMRQSTQCLPVTLVTQQDMYISQYLRNHRACCELCCEPWNWSVLDCHIYFHDDQDAKCWIGMHIYVQAIQVPNGRLGFAASPRLSLQSSLGQSAATSVRSVQVNIFEVFVHVYVLCACVRV